MESKNVTLIETPLHLNIAADLALSPLRVVELDNDHASRNDLLCDSRD